MQAATQTNYPQISNPYLSFQGNANTLFGGGAQSQLSRGTGSASQMSNMLSGFSKASFTVFSQPAGNGHGITFIAQGSISGRGQPANQQPPSAGRNDNHGGQSNSTAGNRCNNNPTPQRNDCGSKDSGKSTQTPPSKDCGKSTQTPPSKDCGKSSQTPPSKDSGKSTQTPPSKDCGKSTQTPPSKDCGKSTQTPPSKDSGKSTQTPPSKDCGKSTQTPPSKDSGKSTQTPPSKDCGKSTQTPPSKDCGKSTQTPPSKDCGKSTQTPPSKDCGKSTQTPPSKDCGKSTQTPPSKDCGGKDSGKSTQTPPGKDCGGKDSGKSTQTPPGKDCGKSNQTPPRNDCGGKDSGKSSQTQWSDTAVCNNKASIDLGNYKLDFNKADSSMVMTNTKSGDTTKIFGDPHLTQHANTANSTTEMFNGPMTFVLPDKTKVTVGTQVATNDKNLSFADQVTITHGKQAYQVTGLSEQNQAGLTVTKSNNGRALDAAAPDGYTVKAARGGTGWIDPTTGKEPTPDNIKKANT